MKDLSVLKPIPQQLESSEVLKLQSVNLVSMESASNEPFDIFDDKAIPLSDKMCGPLIK